MLVQNCNVAADEFLMNIALEEAAKAALLRDVPVGAVVVYDGEVIGRGRNQREGLQSLAPPRPTQIACVIVQPPICKNPSFQYCPSARELSPT